MRQSRRIVAQAVCCAALCLIVCMPVAALGQIDERDWPNIQNPGMDLGDFPNSSYTIPAGTFQVEIAPLSILGEDRFDRPQYFTQFLLRYGVTDDVEFRVLGDGLTVLYTDPQVTGFSPISLDAKVHLWDAHRESLIPASSLEVVLTTNWGTSALSSGFQPSINLNFDLPVTDSLNLEWTVGYGEVVGTVLARSRRGELVQVEGNDNQALFQWAVEQNVTDRLQVFVTGQVVEPVTGVTAGTSVAFGGSWAASDRLMYFALLGWGLTPNAPKIAAQAGLGIALGRRRER